MRISTPSSLSRFKAKLSLFDLFWLFAAPFLALAVRGPEFIDARAFPQSLPPTYEYALITFISSIPFFIFFRTSEGISYLFSVRDVLSVTAATLCSVAASVYTVFSITRLDGIPRTVPVIYGLILIVGLISYRIVARSYYERSKTPHHDLFSYKTANDIRRVILIGVDQFSIAAIKITEAQRPRTTQIIAAISPDNKHAGKSFGGVRILGDLSGLGALIDEYRIHGVEINEIWLSDNVAPIPPETAVFIENQCDSYGVKYRTIAEAFNLTPHISAASIPDHETSPLPAYANSYLMLKRPIDVICSIICLLALLPLYPIISLLVLLDVGTPILFWQQRTGWRAKTFLLYKFRTLRHADEGEGDAETDANRMTKIGFFLRTSRLDEIPQLLNIIVGDMSLIGPRPLLPRDEPRDNRLRLSIRPGVTGWAQVHGNNLLTPDERNALDCWYIKNAKIFVDLIIIYKTFLVVLHGTRRDENIIQSGVAWAKEENIYD